MEKYELLLISKREDTILSKVKELIGGFGGKILKEDIWGMRKLAYPIKKSTSGFYAILDIEMDGGKVKELLKKLELEENVLRSLVFS
jgi:small subunit ribosomal protein S6